VRTVKATHIRSMNAKNRADLLPSIPPSIRTNLLLTPLRLVVVVVVCVGVEVAVPGGAAVEAVAVATPTLTTNRTPHPHPASHTQSHTPPLSTSPLSQSPVLLTNSHIVVPTNPVPSNLPTDSRHKPAITPSTTTDLTVTIDNQKRSVSIRRSIANDRSDNTPSLLIGSRVSTSLPSPDLSKPHAAPSRHHTSHSPLVTSTLTPPPAHQAPSGSGGGTSSASANKEQKSNALDSNSNSNPKAGASNSSTNQLQRLDKLPLPHCFKLDAWRTLLATHPKRDVVQVALDGIAQGVRIGYFGSRSAFRDCANLTSADEQPEAITADLNKEVLNGRMAGPFDPLPAPNLMCSPIGAVPKDEDDWRRIHHLSWPRNGDSVNAFIEDIELRYPSFDDAVKMARKLGRGALLAKVDVKSAFRCVAVHPSDRHLLGMKWLGKYYVDLCLPFGMKSSPGLWERYASLAHWIALTQFGVRWLVHYVDDFLIAGAPDSDECKRAVEALCKCFAILGVPRNVVKFALEGTPSCVIRFLGVMLDTLQQIAYLDDQRMQQIRTELAAFAQLKSVTRKELQSLIGTLSFAARIIDPGRSFLQRMINSLRNSERNNRSHIKLGAEFQRDVVWWRLFMDQWNGKSFWYDEQWTPADSDTLQLSTDASVKGYGAVCRDQWFTGVWSADQKHAAKRSKRESMPYLELLALTLAACTWGHLWQRRRIVFLCDCKPVVDALAFGRRANTSPMQSLIRTLHFLAFKHGFAFRCAHIASVANGMADVLSRCEGEQAAVQRFLESNPTVCRSPTPVLPLPTHNW
jgi:hypothetical protein